MSSESLFSKIPVLSNSSEYVKWALAIKGYARMFEFWDVLNGTDAYPVKGEGDATISDQTLADVRKEWRRFDNKACGLMLRSTAKDINLQLNSLRFPDSEEASGK